MPELPEVETVRRGLEALVIGKKIESVTVSWARIIQTPVVEEFTVDLIGETLNSVSRRGKYLIFHFTHWDMVSHLRMEGKYHLAMNGDEPVTKHTHVIFKFTDQTELRYLDTRKFGRMALYPKGKFIQNKGLSKLGPEPLTNDFILSEFQQTLKKHHKAIKPVLLDQTVVAGIGNIYADEVLFLAEIHPEQPADSLLPKETTALYKSIKEVLKKAVTAGGTTVHTYQNALGEAGNFQVELNAYGQNGTPCPRCGTEIIKIKVAQRGTHFCPHCQRLRKRKNLNNK